MPSVFDRALATLHRDRNIGTAASYERPPADPVALRIVWTAPPNELGDSAGPGARTGARFASVVHADLAELAPPARGDRLTVGAATYQVESVAPDDQAMSSTLTLARITVIARRFTIGVSAIGGPDPIG